MTILFLTFLVSYAALPDDIAKDLQKNNKLGVSYEECSEIESKIGQLLYINVDGHGSTSTIDPYYNKLVKRIQPGGVLPSFTKYDARLMKEASDKLQDASDLPLMIGVDYEKTYLNNSNQTVGFGLGYGGGFLDSMENRDLQCIEDISLIEAALHRVIGLNHSLGPTIEVEKKENSSRPETSVIKDKGEKIIDAFSRLQVETTIKHYPYTPQSYDYNLHDRTDDTKIPKDEVYNDYLPIYEELKDKSGFLMTTHLYNSNIDEFDLATFSDEWMRLLREEIGFKGLVMTDALFMMANYSENIKNMTRNWEENKGLIVNDDYTIFAAKAIIAGHDMVFLETPALITEKLFKNLITLSCQDNSLGKKLRLRVLDSYDRIKKYKEENRETLKNKTVLSNEEIQRLIDARKDADKLCKEGTSKYEDIFRKLEGDLFQRNFEYCHESFTRKMFATENKNVQDLLSLVKSVQYNLSTSEYVDCLVSGNAELTDFALKILNDDKNNADGKIFDSVLLKGLELLNSKKREDRIKAIELFESLDILPKEVLNNVLGSDDENLKIRLLQAIKSVDNIETPDIPMESFLVRAKQLDSELIKQGKDFDEFVSNEMYRMEYSPLIPLLKMYLPKELTPKHLEYLAKLDIPEDIKFYFFDSIEHIDREDTSKGFNVPSKIWIDSLKKIAKTKSGEYPIPAIAISLLNEPGFFNDYTGYSIEEQNEIKEELKNMEKSDNFYIRNLSDQMKLTLMVKEVFSNNDQINNQNLNDKKSKIIDNLKQGFLKNIEMLQDALNKKIIPGLDHQFYDYSFTSQIATPTFLNYLDVKDREIYFNQKEFELINNVHNRLLEGSTFYGLATYDKEYLNTWLTTWVKLDSIEH